MKRNGIRNIWKYILLVLFISELCWAQLDLKRDDYTGDSRRNWWHWYEDGAATPLPDVLDGFVLFSLINPDENHYPFSDAAFWDGYPWTGGPYGNCEIVLRAKALNPHRFGSRGWGLWYTEGAPNLQRQIWFMQVLDSVGTGYTGLNWWRAETSNGRTEATHHYTDLDQSPYNIDMEEWHVYRIVRDAAYISMEIDGDEVLYTEEDLPTENLGFHIWVDNLVYEHVDPDIINIYRRGWTGENEIVLDYVQILSSGTLGHSETPSGIMLLREIPNEIYTEPLDGLWKSYSFESPGTNCIAIISARVEQYLDEDENEISNDDDIRIVFDGTDYGWNTENSFNGDAQGTVSRTKVIQKSVSYGSANIDIYGGTSPLLYDVTVLGSDGGGIVFNQEYNETYSGSGSPWKEIDFLTWGGEVAIYISASADEDPTPSDSTHYGSDYADYNDDDDDDITITLDGHNYGSQNDTSFYGNRQFGEPKSILITENLSMGSHTLQLSASNTPTLHRVVIYGENDDVSLPVYLTSFTGQSVRGGVSLEWVTASEVNNLGFNIYRAVETAGTDVLIFEKINNSLIEGNGNKAAESVYSYLDTDVTAQFGYHYILEDVSYEGVAQKQDTIHVFYDVDQSDAQLAADYLIYNYPNPFNMETLISVNLKKNTEIKVNIYDISGKVIKSLYQGAPPNGKFETIWRGDNNFKQVVSSGLYFIHVFSDNQLMSRRKILLTK